MDWYDKKTRRNVFRVALLIILLTVACFFYAWYQKENLLEYQRQDSYLHPVSVDSVSLPDMRAAVRREIDSIKKASGGDTPSSFYSHVTPSSEPNHSSLPVPAKPQQSVTEKDDADTKSNSGVLQPSTALFSHIYTIEVGKTIPVNIRWAENGASEATYKLVAVKLDDIAGKKATFTIEDSFKVLLFSQTGYSVNDKIIIADKRHNITLSVLEVNADSVVIKLVAHLTGDIVSKLQKIT